MEVLRQALEVHRTDEIVSEIIRLLSQEAQETMSRYTVEQQRRYMREVLDAGRQVGVLDLEHLVNWAFIRFSTGMPFYNAKQIRDILDDPLLHPYAKGRHIVIAFFAIQRMRQEGQPWQQ